jgi:hypothetical protein
MIKPNINLEAVKSHLLFYLWRRKKPVTTGDLKSKILGTNISYEDVFNSLFQLNYIAVNGNEVQLSKEGKYAINEQIQKENKHIQTLVSEEEFELALLDFLYYRPHLVHLEDFPDLLKQHAPQHGNSINNGNLIQYLWKLEQKGYVHHPFNNWYGLHETGRAFYEHQIMKYNKAQEQQGKSLKIISPITINQFSGGNNQVNSPGASMEISSQVPGGASEELAKEQLKDWPKAKKNRKWTLIWTVIGVIAGLAALYFAWKSYA